MSGHVRGCVVPGARSGKGPGLGHNGGPTIEPGKSWRIRCWRTARAELLPKLPIEVVRLRLRRAAEIGLDYKTYAGVRASTGHDIVALLFSTNALRLLRAGQTLDAARAAKLAALHNAGRLLAVQPPHEPLRLTAALGVQGVEIHHAIRAPAASCGWSDTARALRSFLAETRHSPDTVLVVGDTTGERDWAAAGRMAGYLPADRFFIPAGA